ncbi:BgTH12-00962 [Blumeria graminis f. sp. triticale]|uniref:BgTH12-00962 n=1 Tax=Blumeria graminis f. sp. triticale TaxID=1689686 RepID=A0A9W4D7E1_BLUGR|nr:BgTH12-00962 [Blumeria graminis f. sp. triticale]
MLNASQVNPYLNRMVIVSNDQSNQGYYIYDAHNADFFVPDASYDLRIAKFKPEGFGTYSTMYCSEKMGVPEIRNKITISRSDITGVQMNAHAADRLTIKKCHDEIEKKKKRVKAQKEDQQNQSIDVVLLSALDETNCPPAALATMSFVKIISVHGKYSSFSPKQRPTTVQLIADKKIDLAKLVYDGQIFPGKYWKQNKVALTWYQGNLHLIQLRDSGWYFLTDLIYESSNGAMIYFYMLGISPETWNLKNGLITEINKKLNFHVSMNYFNTHIWRLIQLPNLSTMETVEISAGRLNPTFANGFLGAVSN